MHAVTERPAQTAGGAEPDLAERVLALLGPAPVYAVLDGARDRRVRGFVRDSRAPAWCLYRGPIPAVLEDAAPWLLRLVPGADYTRRFFELGWGRAWGVLLSTSAHSTDLRRHLRRFLVARGRGGVRLLFRYYDPRVLRVYLRSCDAAERARFFGPLEAIAAESAAGLDLFDPQGHREIACP